MCDWCKKETEGTPQVSGAKIPMVCEHCGTHIGWFDWKKLRLWKKGEHHVWRHVYKQGKKKGITL